MPTKRPHAIILSILSLALLSFISGCGAPDGNQPGNDTPPSSYEALDSTASVTSTFGGTGLKLSISGGASLVALNGSLTHDTKAITVSDGTYTLVGVLNGTGGVSDGNRQLQLTTDINGYQYAQSFYLFYTSGGTVDSAVAGVGGVVTHPSHVPTSGNGTYVGVAMGAIGKDGRVIELTNGYSTVEVDFGAGTADVMLTGFTPEFDIGSKISSPLDTIAVNGMNISGNAFSGGTFITTKDGTVVNITGANTDTFAGGNFYGIDNNGIPDEVGGIILSTGDAGSVSGMFIAD